MVRVGYDRSGWVKTEKGVRQGYVLSPDFFSLYTQSPMNEIAELDGVNIDG